MSKRIWAEKSTSVSYPTLPASSFVAVFLAVALMAGASSAQKSVLVKSAAAKSTTSVSSTSATPADPVPAAQENVTSQFRPVSGSASQQASAGEGGAIKLKWRARHPNSFALNGAGKQPAEVRQATQLIELNDADPFEDPFEDKARSRFSSTQVQPLDQDLNPQPRSDFQIPAGPDECENCPNKCYNGRNCCEELERCANAQQIIRDYTIKGISLNISPTFKPDAESVEELNAARDEQLFQASSRVWRDIDGNALAEGNLIDYRNGRVYIATEDGETKKYSVGILSDDDRCFVAAWWKIPPSCRLGTDEYVARAHTPITMTWTASQVCHKPLYFEEIALERYGHTSGPIIQPWLSGAHFFANIAIFPYKAGINPLGECQYDLGYYRPGNCAPWLIPPVPLSPRGALFQAGAVTGVSYLIP